MRLNTPQASGEKSEPSAVDSMRSLPVRLETLPEDGTVLEDLIANLQSEYGVPATPQEYRLIIRTPASDDEHTEVDPPEDSGRGDRPEG